MFDKILIANRGESVRAADDSAKPHGLVRAAHAGDLDPIEVQHV